MTETPPPEPVVIPGQDPQSPVPPDEAPQPGAPAELPDVVPVEQPSPGAFPDDESGRPLA